MPKVFAVYYNWCTQPHREFSRFAVCDRHR